VSGNPRLITDAEVDLLFDPTSSEDIAKNIARFAALPPQTCVAIGAANRAKAEQMLAPDIIINQYLQVMEAVLRARDGNT
jgi:glycosyltransferase involved in cell wall biosynthesis